MAKRNPKKTPIDSRGVIDYKQYSLTANLEKDIAMVKSIFYGDDTVIYREFTSHDRKIRCCVVFVDGMVNQELINLNLIKPITQFAYEGKRIFSPRDGIDIIEGEISSCNELKSETDIEKLVGAVMYGDTLLLVDGAKTALIAGSKGFALRSISEPDNEKSLRGPREGFVESIMLNLSMIRRRLQTSDLKISMRSYGTRSGTRVAVCYLESLVDKEILEELEKRLARINIDGVLSANYIEELIKDERWSPFKTTGTTEKPDIAASKLLEGRIALVIDGSPLVLTAPFLFIENFQAPDDYYLNFYFASFGRIVRFISFFLTISIPAIYIALVNHHQEMIPNNLIVSIADASSNTPFPTAIECLGMMLIFEIMREAGVRASNKIGQALSIVGGLVIGQAAIEAKFIAAPTVIIVSLSSITGILLQKLGGVDISTRYLSLLASVFLGIFGYFFVISLLSVHLFSLKSFGTDYISTSQGFKPDKKQDYYVRMPQWKMKNRPGFAADIKRQE